jgi:hypothetical protein
MPANRELTMRQLRQMLRLHYEGLGAREIGRRLRVARSTIQDNLKRARAAGLAWPLAPDLADEVLEQRLFHHSGTKPSCRRRTEPEWALLAPELKRPGVNLMVLWEEYRAAHPSGYAYSRFCELFREYERRLSPVMRQHHVAGDKVFVEKRLALPTLLLARSVRRRSSSRYSGRAATPTRRRPGRKRYPTGSARMSACSASFRAVRDL